MNAKKIIAILLVLMMILGATVGCTKNSTSDIKDQTAESKTEVNGEPKKEEPKEEKEKGPYAKYVPDENKVYKFDIVTYIREPVPDDDDIKALIEEKFNVKLNLWNLEQSNYVELLNLRVVSGEIPDMFEFSGQASMAPELYRQGVTLPLDRALLDYGMPNAMAQLDMQKPGWEDWCRAEDGIMFKLPDFNIKPNQQAIIWRGDWLKNVGITKIPETLEEFEAALYAFAHEDPNKSGNKDTYGASTTVMQPVFGAFGAMPFWSFGYEKDFSNTWHIKDGELVFAGIQPEMKDALAMLNKWYVDEVLDPEFVLGENQGGYWAHTHPFFNSKIGYTGHGAVYHWSPPMHNEHQGGPNYKELMLIDPAIAESYVFGVAPVGPNGKKGVSGNPYINITKGAGFGSHLADEPDKFGKLMQCVDFRYSGMENSRLYAGEEGKHYTFKEVTGWDGKTYQLQLATEYGIEVYPRSAERVFRIFTAYFPDSLSDPDLAWRKFMNFGEHIYVNQLDTILPSDAQYANELVKLTSETYYQIITGGKPIEYFDEYVDIWWKNGGKIMHEEANEWLR